MPGFDGTGPMGQGPMTGGGRGFCAMPYGGFGPYGYGFRAPYYQSVGMRPFYGQPFYGPVFGAGRGGLPTEPPASVAFFLKRSKNDRQGQEPKYSQVRFWPGSFEEAWKIFRN